MHQLSKYQPHGLFATEKLKLERDFSKYNYLSLDSAAVSNLDDAANFRTVRVSISHTHLDGIRSWVDFITKSQTESKQTPPAWSSGVVSWCTNLNPVPTGEAVLFVFISVTKQHERDLEVTSPEYESSHVLEGDLWTRSELKAKFELVDLHRLRLGQNKCRTCSASCGSPTASKKPKRNWGNPDDDFHLWPSVHPCVRSSLLLLIRSTVVSTL